MQRRDHELQRLIRCPATCASESWLAAVGARREASHADVVTDALHAWVDEIDSTVQTLVDSAPALVVPVVDRRRRRSRPAMAAALGAAAALVAVVMVRAPVRHDSDSVVSVATSAQAQSTALLRHARQTLNKAAAARTDPTRRGLVAEARADLQHVRKLLPLLPTPERAQLAKQVHAQTRKAKVAKPTQATRRSNPAPVDRQTSTPPPYSRQPAPQNRTDQQPQRQQQSQQQPPPDSGTGSWAPSSGGDASRQGPRQGDPGQTGGSGQICCG